MMATAAGYVHGLATSLFTSAAVLMGLLFFPRGGSAHVARNLAHALPHAGWDVDGPVGSVSVPGPSGRRARASTAASTSARST